MGARLLPVVNFLTVGVDIKLLLKFVKIWDSLILGFMVYLP